MGEPIKPMQPEIYIYMDNLQQRMYDITIDIPDNYFLYLHGMFNDIIDTIKSENDV